MGESLSVMRYILCAEGMRNTTNGDLAVVYRKALHGIGDARPVSAHKMGDRYADPLLAPSNVRPEPRSGAIRQ